MPPYLFPESVWYVQGIHHARVVNLLPPSLAFSRHIPSLSFLSVNAFFGAIISQWRIEYRLADWLCDSSADSGLGPPGPPHTDSLTHARTTEHFLLQCIATWDSQSLALPTALVISQMPSMTIQDMTYSHCRWTMIAPCINIHTNTELIMEAQHHPSYWYSLQHLQRFSLKALHRSG